MAEFIPPLSQYIDDTDHTTWGERRVAERLSQVLDSRSICWHEPRIAGQNHPDFIILHPTRGLLILEVKDWYANRIINIDAQNVVLNTRDGPRRKRHPIAQARSYAMQVERQLQNVAELRHDGGNHKGRLRFPYAYGVVLARVSRAEFKRAKLSEVMPGRHVICADDLDDSLLPSEFRKKLWDMFWPRFGCKLSKDHVQLIRDNLSPVVSPQQLLDESTRSPAVTAEVVDVQRLSLNEDFNTARSAVANGDMRQAGDVLRNLVIESRDALGERDPDTLVFEAALAEHYSRVGDHDASLGLLKRLVRQQAEVYGDDDQRTVSTRLSLARAHKRSGSYSDAAVLFERVLSDRRRFGASHPQSLDISEQIAECETWLGAWDDALLRLESVVDRRNATAGKMHTSTLRARAGIARLLIRRGRPRSALELVDELIETHKKASPGSDGAGVFAQQLATLRADALMNLGQVIQARNVYSASLDFYECTLGDAHTLSATTRVAVATCMRHQGDPAEAMELLHTSLDVLRLRFGEKHPAVFQIKRELALCLFDLGRIDRGLMLQAETLNHYRTILGDDNPETIATMTAFGRHLSASGENNGARALLEEAVGKSRRTLGEQHPTTLIAIRCLARCLNALGDSTSATSLLDDAIRGLSRILGDNHPETLDAMHIRGELLFAAERYTDAGTAFGNAARSRAECLGERHPLTLASRLEAAHCLMLQKRTVDAVPLLRAVLDARRARDDTPDVQIVVASVSLAGALMTLGHYTEAKLLLDQAIGICNTAIREIPREQIRVHAAQARLADETGDRTGALAMYQRTLGRCREVYSPEDRFFLSVLSATGNCLRQNGKAAEARALLEEAVATSRRVLGDAHTTTRKRVQSLAVCLLELNDIDGARLLKIDAARRRDPVHAWDAIDGPHSSASGLTSLSSKPADDGGPGKALH